MNNIIFSAIAGLGIIVVILLVLVIQQRNTINALKKKYEYFTKGKDINIDQVLLQTMERMDTSEKELADLKKKHEALNEKVKGCLQVVKLNRYDAFDGMGGEMSYSLLITDAKKNGLILTSIYGREDSRSFAKEVVEGKAKTALAEEEASLL